MRLNHAGYAVLCGLWLALTATPLMAQEDGEYPVQDSAELADPGAGAQESETRKAQNQDENIPYFNISASGVRKIVVAVPGFTGSAAQGNAGLAASKLVSEGFALYSFLDLVDYGAYGGRRDADWKAWGTDYVVRGEINSDAGGLAVSGQLLEVATGRTLPPRVYKGPVSQLEELTLRLGDALMEDLTGEPGVSRTRLAYVSDATGRKEAYVSDVLGRHPRQVTRHKALVVSPRFSPDGNTLAYTSYHRGNQDLYLTDLRQNTQTGSISRRPGLNLAPAFTPDGNMVVTLSVGGDPDLYLMDRNGQILRRLTERAGINVSPSISPDGRMLAFSSDRARSGHPKVYVMDMTSLQVRLLQNTVHECSEPSWSPKGDEIAFTGLVGGRYQIFVCDRNGGNVRQVSSGSGDFEAPSWAPDGRLIAAAHKTGGRSRICVLNKNAKDVRALLDLRGNLTFPQWSPRLP